MDDLSSERGYAPTVADVASATDFSVEEVLEAIEAAHAYQARPLESAGADDEQGRQDVLPELGRREAGYELVEVGASVQPVVKSLPEREQEILRLRFIEDLTQSQIAERVGVSQMHVSRLIRRAVGRLEDAVDEDPVERQAPAAAAQG